MVELVRFVVLWLPFFAFFETSVQKITTRTYSSSRYNLYRCREIETK